MIEKLEQKQLNFEMEKYLNDTQEEQQSFEFVKLGFNVDMREAQVRYKEEWRENIRGIKTAQISFSQWLDQKKFEATKFYLKHSNHYLEF